MFGHVADRIIAKQKKFINAIFCRANPGPGTYYMSLVTNLANKPTGQNVFFPIKLESLLILMT